MHFATLEDLTTIHLAAVRDLFRPIRLYASDGLIWTGTIEHSWKPSLISRLRSLFNKDLQVTVDLTYSRVGKFSLFDLKSTLERNAENHPGDMIFQFLDPEQLSRGIEGSNSVEALFDFIDRGICGRGA